MFVLVVRRLTERQDMTYFICCPVITPEHVTMVSVLFPHPPL